MLNYIQTHDNVTWAHLRKVCVTEFGCTNEQSGSIGASFKTLQYHNKIRVDGSGEDKRIRLNVIQNSQKLTDSTIEGQIEIFHYFPKNKLKATATFDPSSKKIIYNGEHNLSPSGAAIKAGKENTGKYTSLNGWT